DTLQTGLGGFDAVRVNAKGQVFGLDKTIVAPGKLVLKHFRVLGADAVKIISLERDGDRAVKGFLRCCKVQKRQLKANRAVKVVEKVTPALDNRGFILILRELIVDVLKLDGFCVVAICHT